MLNPTTEMRILASGSATAFFSHKAMIAGNTCAAVHTLTGVEITGDLMLGGFLLAWILSTGEKTLSVYGRLLTISLVSFLAHRVFISNYIASCSSEVWINAMLFVFGIVGVPVLIWGLIGENYIKKLNRITENKLNRDQENVHELKQFKRGK